MDFLHAQVEELVTQYGPVDILWWDYSSEDFQGETAWRASELMARVRAAQPGIIMNNRLHRTPEAGWKSMGTDGFTGSLDPKFGDFITPEQHIPDTGLPGVDWETCMTLNTTWGYSEHDHAWKSSETLIRNLVDIASKGGNYLLNIGPKGDGSVPEETIQAMSAIGAWMRVNRESIIGTIASPLPRPSWGRMTARESAGGTTLYLHVFDWPATGRIQFEGVPNPILGARLLSGGGLRVESRDGVVSVVGPGLAPDPVDAVIAVHLAGPLAKSPGTKRP